MGKSIVDREQLKIAKTELSWARNQLTTNQSNDAIVPVLNGVIVRLEGSDIWEGDACEAYLVRLREQRDALMKLYDVLGALESHCDKVDGTLEAYIRYIQSLFGRDF